MGSGPTVRRLAVAAALLLAGGAAFLVLPPDRDASPVARPPGAEEPADGPNLFDESVLPAPEPAGPSAPATAEEGTAPDGGTGPDAAEALLTEKMIEELQARLDSLSTELDSLRLPASPDADPATGEAPAVAAGRPPEMALAAFVADRASVDRAVELVGDRRPELDDGVPVSITGRVLEADGGAPLPGATVLVTSTFYVRRYFYDHHLREVARAETDGDGNYAIERLNIDPAHFGRGGRLYLTVTAPAHAPALAVALARVTPGVANRLRDVSLARAAETVTGRVLDLDGGLPVAGARVIATGAIDPVSYPKDERPALFVGAPETVTDAEGRFTLEGLGRGVQVISAHGGDDCLGRTTVVLPRSGEVLFRVRAIRGRIEGTTVDGGGNPVALVTVDGGGNSTHSFADGRFVLENFQGDAVTIRFTHPDFPPVVLEGVRDGTAGLLVRMEAPRPVVVLEVRDRDSGLPVTSVRVLFRYAEGAPPSASTSPARLSKAGRYPVRVPGGVESLVVAAEGREPEEVPLAGRFDGEVIPVVLGAAGE